jgi:hypothetical protein
VTSALHRILDQLESDPALFAPAGLRARLEALDQLDLYFGSPGSHSSTLSPEGEVLCERAAALHSRLEAANAALYHSMRSEMQAGARPCQLDHWLHANASQPLTPGLSYDLLDEAVSGVLQLPDPAEPHAMPEPDMVFYQPTPARHILDLIALCGFSDSDVLVDIGSGVGHVPILVSILAGIRATGIELDSSYVGSARDCAHHLRLPNVTFLQADARVADLSGGTVFYLYTPFTGALLDTVIGRLKREASRRPITIATLGPCTRTFAAESWLQPRSNPDPDRISLFSSRF